MVYNFFLHPDSESHLLVFIALSRYSKADSLATAKGTGFWLLQKNCLHIYVAFTSGLGDIIHVECRPATTLFQPVSGTHSQPRRGYLGVRTLLYKENCDHLQTLAYAVDNHSY